MRWLLVLVIASGVAYAQAPGETPVLQQPATPDGRDTERIAIGVGWGVFVGYPMGIAYEGVAVSAARPLWLGVRHCCFQWVLDVDAMLAYANKTGFTYVGPRFGFNIYIKSVFGFEARVGTSLIAQLGHDSVLGLGLTDMAGAAVLRLWDDDRRRLKLGFSLAMGLYFQDDPGNDMAMNAGHYVLSAAYETPF